jgi:hypothetical protein
MNFRLGVSLALSVDRAARLGHLATGATYVIVGAVAFLASFGRPAAMDSQGALRYVFSEGLGRAVLLAIAVGFAADFVWQIVRAVTNADRAPAGLRGIADRAGWTISGCVHLALAVTVVKLAFDLPQRTAEHQAQVTTAAVMSLPFGQVGLIVAGSVTFLVGLQMLYRAGVGDVDRWLDLRSLHRIVRTGILALGRFGLGARGIVFCTGGAILVGAAIQSRPWQARALGGTLSEIGNISVGPALLAVVALGFIAFGVLEILSASYRRINVQ